MPAGATPWRIYYADGTTWDPINQGPWTEAPTHGVVCVNVQDRTRPGHSFTNSGYGPRRPRCEVCGRAVFNELYVMPPRLDGVQEPYATHDTTDRWSRDEHLAHPFIVETRRRGFSDDEIKPRIKYGLQIGQVEWEAAMNLAAADPDFPKTSPRRRFTDFKV